MYINPTQRYGAVGQCFANKNGTGCKIMQSEICDGVCGFHKTRKAAKASLRAANVRLASLPHDEQQYIADKYYGGNMPWLGMVRV